MIIYKYALVLEQKFSIVMQKNARIIDCRMQGDRPCLWAIVDEYAPQELKHFQWIGTGEPFGNFEGKYINTVQVTDGLVGHLFEILKDKKQ